MSRLALPLLAALLLIGGCGDDGGLGVTTAPPTTAAPATTTTEGATTTTTEPVTTTAAAADDAFDGRIGLVVTDVEVRPTAPPEIDLPPAGAGNTYVLVTITVTRIESDHLRDLVRNGAEVSTARLSNGDTANVRYATVSGIRFSDPTSITSSAEIVVDAVAILVFEVPQGTEVLAVDLVYTATATMADDADELRGELTLPVGT